MLQITIRRGEIGLPQQSIKRSEQISLATRAAEMTPEAHALLARRPVLPIVLRLADHRGYATVGTVKVILELQRKPERSQQVTNDKRLVPAKAVNALDRHLLPTNTSNHKPA